MLRIHIFVDAENVSSRLFEKSYKYLKNRYEVVQVDVFSKENTLPNLYRSYNGNCKFNYIKCFYGKNSADTFMTTSIVKALYEEPLTGGFVLVTQDRDFAPAIKAITDCNKQAIIVTEKNKIINNIKAVGANMKFITNIETEVVPTKALNEKFKKFNIPEEQKQHLTRWDMSQTIFIKGNGNMSEVYFCNGMDYDKFLNIIPVQRIRTGFPKSKKLADILAESFLIVEDNKIYLDIDRIFEEEEK